MTSEITIVRVSHISKGIALSSRARYHGPLPSSLEHLAGLDVHTVYIGHPKRFPRQAFSDRNT